MIANDKEDKQGKIKHILKQRLLIDEGYIFI